MASPCSRWFRPAFIQLMNWSGSAAGGAVVTAPGVGLFDADGVEPFWETPSRRSQPVNTAVGTSSTSSVTAATGIRIGTVKDWSGFVDDISEGLRVRVVNRRCRGDWPVAGRTI